MKKDVLITNTGVDIVNTEDWNEEPRRLGTTRFQFVYVSFNLILSYHNAHDHDQSLVELINTAIEIPPMEFEVPQK